MSAQPQSPQPATLPLPVQSQFEPSVYQSFIRSLRNFWREETYQRSVKTAGELGAVDPVTMERRMRETIEYQLYAWLERHSQQFKYYHRHGVIPTVRAKQAELLQALDAARARHPERLRLDPDFEVPGYVREVDIHQHAQGTWSDPTDGVAYESATTGFSFSLLNADLPMTIYADTARRLLGEGARPGRLVDLGCTIGGATRALKRAFPGAEVFGCDVSAPALTLAHLRAMEQGLDITWVQAAAESLPFDDASVDLIGSHWLFHEMTPAAIRESLREAWRTLRPGGAIMVQDMYLTPGGEVGRWLAAGYAARNNEPFAYSYANMDMRAELEAVGFAEVDMGISYPPAEPDGTLPAARTHYVTMVTARKPGA